MGFFIEWESETGCHKDLQEFSANENYDYYLVICAIYNMYRLDEGTDFSDITWDKSDLLKTNKGIATTEAVNKDEGTGKSGYRNLFTT